MKGGETPEEHGEWMQLPPTPNPYSSGLSPEGGAAHGGIRTVLFPRTSLCALWPQLLLIAFPISPAWLHLEISDVCCQLLCGDQVGPGKHSQWKPSNLGPSCVCSA